MTIESPGVLNNLLFENEELKRKLDHFDTLFQATHDAIAVIDGDFYLIKMNRAFQDLFSTIFGIEIQIHMNLTVLLSKFSNKNRSIITACKKALNTETSIAVINENGQPNQKNYYCYEVLISPTYGLTHGHELILGIRDLTLLKLQEHERYRQQIDLTDAYKINAMREVASAMAHELNQPLAAIVTYARTCLIKWKDLSQREDLQHVLEQIILQAEHADRLIQSVRKIIKTEDLYYENFDMNTLIEEAILILGYELENYNLKIELNANEDCRISADKTQILQVILNLCRNSIEALKSVSEQEPILSIYVEKMSETIAVNIRDNGPGVPKDIQNLLFNSYYSSKPQGMGLGLVMCFSIIQQHQGNIVLKKIEGKGACFSFSLPVQGSIDAEQQ